MEEHHLQLRYRKARSYVILGSLIASAISLRLPGPYYLRLGMLFYPRSH
jgi:hypothetical protein